MYKIITIYVTILLSSSIKILSNAQENLLPQLNKNSSTLDSEVTTIINNGENFTASTTILNLSSPSPLPSSSTILNKFMNENKNKTNILPSPHATSFDFLQDHFDFNPNDFEDLHENFKKGNLNENHKHLSELSENNQKNFNDYFEQITNNDPVIYDDDIIINNDDDHNLPEETNYDSKNIYKIKNPKHIKLDSFNNNNELKKLNNNNNDNPTKLNQLEIYENITSTTTNRYNQFYLITNLFDHNNWNIHMITKNVSDMCSKKMKIYLKDLQILTPWALKGLSVHSINVIKILINFIYSK